MSYYSVTKIHNDINKDHLKIKFNNMEETSYYINITIKNVLNKIKKKISLCGDDWNNIKKITNPYEYIHTVVPNHKTSISKIKPLSRAFFKLIEICKIFHIFDNYSDKPIKTFHLAEGPGGFIEAVTYMRFNKYDKYYGMTLIDETNAEIPGWRKSEMFLQKNPNVTIEAGSDNTGNLYNPKNFNYCLQKYQNSMDFITGDGGFDFSINYNSQETMASRLIFTQIMYAIGLQAEGGTFVLKVFDQFSKCSVDILYFLSTFYSKMYIFKPDTSRIANSERYIICKNFKMPKNKNIYIKFEHILTIFNNINFSDISLHRILNININNYFVKNIEEINAIIAQQQVYNILTTLKIIQNKEKKCDKTNIIKNKNIKKCIQWCETHNIPYYKYGVSSNVFMSGKRNSNYFTNN